MRREEENTLDFRCQCQSNKQSAVMKNYLKTLEEDLEMNGQINNAR